MRLAQDIERVQADLLEIALGEVGEAAALVGLPQPIRGGGGVVAEALLAVAQARLGELALAQGELVLGQNHDGAALGRLVSQRRQLRGVGQLLLVLHQAVGLLQRIHGERLERPGELVQAVEETVDRLAIAFLQELDLGLDHVEPRQEIADRLLRPLDLEQLGRVGALVEALQPADQHVEAELDHVVAHRRVGCRELAQRIEKAVEVDLGLGRRPHHILLRGVGDLLLLVEDAVEAEEDAGREEGEGQDEDAVAAQASEDAHRCTRATPTARAQLAAAACARRPVRFPRLVWLNSIDALHAHGAAERQAEGLLGTALIDRDLGEAARILVPEGAAPRHLAEGARARDALPGCLEHAARG